MSSSSASEKRAIRVRVAEEGCCVRRLEVEVDAKRVRRAFDRAYRDLAARVPVRGFRPGKAPRSVLEKLYGASVAEQIENTLVAETLAEAIEQAGLEPVSEPAIDAPTPNAAADFRYSVRVEVTPELSLPDARELRARRPRVEVGDEDVDRELEALRQRSAPIVEEPTGTAVAPGHILSVDFVGRIDGEPFEGGTGRGVELEVGSGRFLPGFEDQLVGSQAGEDREVRVRFPDDYGDRRLAGREAVFAVHVVDVKRRVVPELDDEFAKDLGEFGSLEELRSRIRTDLTAERERRARAAMRESLMDSLIESTSFEVPPGMVERQLERQLEVARRRLEGSVPEGSLGAQVERWREEWRGRAEREVREMLLLAAVSRAQGITADDDAVSARIAEMAGEQGVDPAQLRAAYAEDGLSEALRAQLVDEKAIDFLAAQAKVEETTDS